MSRLKEVRLHGFKSFAEPTRFVFQRGVTAIIGPNGSGKSNMADAIRWALGEQSNRSLRTRRADDVIFGGSESRKPIGMAEVVLTLDNQDGWLPIEFAEVTITRRAYRSGDPEYLINGTKSRLRDVIELLAAGRLGANELVVVGQGTVDAALSLRPEERRQLFEEAAGVKSLQVRRNEATAKLAKASDNLIRVSDLVRELKPQVRRLALQAEHQEAHDRLGGQARALVLEHHARRAQGLQSSLGETRRRAAAVAADLEAERGAQAAGRQAVRDAEQRYWATEEASRQAASAWEVAREAVIRSEGRHDGLVERDLDLGADLERARRELTELGDETPGGAPTASSRASDGRRTEAAEAEQAWRAAAEAARTADAEVLAAEDALASMRGREADRLSEAGRWAEREAVGQQRRERLDRELAQATAQLAAAQEHAGALGPVRNAAAEALEAAELRWTEAAAGSASAADESTRAAAALSEIEERARQTTEELATLGPEQNGDPDLADHLRSAGWDGLADELGPVPPDVAAAVAAVLGDLNQALVWRSASALPVDRAAGQAQLLRPANGAPAGRTAALDAVGGSQTLAELLEAPTAPELLHRTVVAPGMESLLAGWSRLPDGWAAVTLAGDVADARGMITVRGRRGPGATTSPGARRADLVARSEVLATQLAEAKSRANDAEAAKERAMRVADAAMAAVESARIVRRRADDDASTAETQVARLTGDLDRFTAELAAIPPAELLSPPRTAMDDELARLEAQAREARGRRDAVGATRDAARERWQTAVAAADEHDAAAADGRAAAARYEVRQAQLRAQVERLELDRATVSAALAEAATILASAREIEATTGATRATAEAARETERQALLDAERRLSGDSGRLAELEAAQQAAAIEASRLEEGLASLAREQELALEGLPEETERSDAAMAATTVDGDEPIVVADLTDEALDEAMRKTRRTLHQIGSVNPFAIQEHAELSTRLQELSSQETDLRSAVESTETLIARLDEDISHQFTAAFAAIGQKFDEYCQLLFAGGSASLELSEDGDSEAPGGIEIAVRPPGKRLQRLAMLSGGERALAGVALLFAMLTVNPVPFCVLDEVDAALDEANIGRFADALRRLAETIDFVVITHNRATIETADTIYGVTMTDAAVSRVLSLRLADLPVAVEA